MRNIHPEYHHTLSLSWFTGGKGVTLKITYKQTLNVRSLYVALSRTEK